MKTFVGHRLTQMKHRLRFQISGLRPRGAYAPAGIQRSGICENLCPSVAKILRLLRTPACAESYGAVRPVAEATGE